MNLKYLSYLIPLVIGALLMYAFTPKGTSEKRELEKLKKNAILKEDSIKNYIRSIQEEKALWLIVAKERKDSLTNALSTATTYQKKYEKARHTPVVRYTEHELDSVIDGLIRR